jgi:pimeloyl-ACP methyl ester carboxylesterase
MSGPHGEDFGVQREVEDMQALIAATGARFIFGLSSGALVSLRTALFTPTVGRVALYEPPLWIKARRRRPGVPRFDREIAAGRACRGAGDRHEGDGRGTVVRPDATIRARASRGPRPACPDGRR